MLESVDARLAFEKAVGLFDPECISVDKVQLAFPKSVDLLQAVEKLIAGSRPSMEDKKLEEASGGPGLWHV